MQSKRRADEPTPELDSERLGGLIRAERNRLFKTPDDFIATMREKTGYEISKANLYKYERGEIEMRISLLVSICMTLYGSRWATELIKLLRYAFSFYTLSVDNALYIDDLEKEGMEPF